MKGRKDVLGRMWGCVGRSLEEKRGKSMGLCMTEHRGPREGVRGNRGARTILCRRWGTREGC